MGQGAIKHSSHLGANMAKKKVAKRRSKAAESRAEVATVATAESNGIAKDGTLTLRDGRKCDALMTRNTAQQLEAKHKLEVIDGFMQPTDPFLLELAESLKMTPTIAHDAWVKSCEYFGKAQKKTSLTQS